MFQDDSYVKDYVLYYYEDIVVYVILFFVVLVEIKSVVISYGELLLLMLMQDGLYIIGVMFVFGLDEVLVIIFDFGDV